MRKVVSIGLLILISCSMPSCKSGMHPDNYVQYVNDPKHGLKRVTQIDGWEFAIAYRPYDLIMLMERSGDSSKYFMHQRRAQLEGSAWFNISIRRLDNNQPPLRYGISSIEEYNERLNYFLNEAAADITMVYGKDTIKPTSYVFENNYNLTPNDKIVVGFALPQGETEPRKDMKVSFADKVYGNGIINASYPASVLKSIPDLIF